MNFATRLSCLLYYRNNSIFKFKITVMLKKITFLVACVAFVAMTTNLSAQETRVSKKIKVFDWLNTAVVDGNQVEGGIHVYADWTKVAEGLKKTARQKVGMLVTVVDAGLGDSQPGTYRLNVIIASPTLKDFTRIDALLVNGMSDRDALIDDIATTDANLAVGTIIGVKADLAGEPAAFFYTGIGGKEWITLGGGSAATGGGFIAAGQGATVYTNGFDFDTAAMTATETIDITDAATKLDTFVPFSFVLTAGGMPFVSFPKAWNKPSFFISVDDKEYPLTDCWTVSYSTQQAVEYQDWVANVNFTTDFDGTTLKLIVR